jgi:septum formation protein
MPDSTDQVVSLPTPRLILASASPRRQQFMRQAGYEYLVHPAEIDEARAPANLLPLDLAKHLAFAKARAVADLYPSDLILAADTIVAFGDRALGKPSGEADARRMLALLSGTTHIVITGVTLMCKATQFEQTRAAMSAVRMRDLRTSEIDAYIASKLWMGKAGGYGIQDDDPFVLRMSGSLSNIVGLPMELTAEMLAGVGVMAGEKKG